MSTDGSAQNRPDAESGSVAGTAALHVAGRSFRPLPTVGASTHGDTDHGRLVRVLVVDDDDELLDLVQLTLELTLKFQLVGRASDGGHAIALSAQLKPDVVVLDLGLPDLPGLHVMAEICRVSPDSRVVVFSGLAEAVVRSEALSGNAASYVRKGSDTAALLRAVELASPAAHKKASAIFVAALQSARESRRFVRTICERWGCREHVDAAELVANELVTNAIVHAMSHVRLTLTLQDRVLRVEVWDNAAEAPNPMVVTGESEHGRGLFLVSALSNSWGVNHYDNGKMVWADLA